MYLLELQFCPNICLRMGLLHHMATLFLHNFKYLHIVPSASVNSVLFEFSIVSEIMYFNSKKWNGGYVFSCCFLAGVKGYPHAKLSTLPTAAQLVLNSDLSPSIFDVSLTFLSSLYLIQQFCHFQGENSTVPLYFLLLSPHEHVFVPSPPPVLTSLSSWGCWQL